MSTLIAILEFCFQRIVAKRHGKDALFLVSLQNEIWPHIRIPHALEAEDSERQKRGHDHGNVDIEEYPQFPRPVQPSRLRVFAADGNEKLPHEEDTVHAHRSGQEHAEIGADKARSALSQNVISAHEREGTKEQEGGDRRRYSGKHHGKHHDFENRVASLEAELFEAVCRHGRKNQVSRHVDYGKPDRIDKISTDIHILENIFEMLDRDVRGQPGTVGVNKFRLAESDENRPIERSERHDCQNRHYDENDGFARDFFLSGGKCEFHFPPPSISAVLDESLCQYRNSGNDEEQEYRLRRRITHIRIGAEGAVINYKHGRHG